MFSYPTLYFDDPPRTGRAIDVWIPENPTRPFALYFVHGGGWRMGHREQMHQIMYGFYREGYPCVSVCYRLGEETIPTQLADVREGMALASEALQKAGFTGPLVLHGGSSGGHLALLAGLAEPGACGDSFRGKAPRVAGIVAANAPTTFIPWENIFPGIWRSMQKAVGTPHEKAPGLYELFSPVTHLGAQSPPLLFLLPECEHMFPNKHAITLVERLRAEGREARYHLYEEAEHGFFYSLTRPAQRKAFSDILAFLADLEAQPPGSAPSP